MSEHDVIEPLLVVAAAILCATLIAKLARKLGLPASVGFMLFGIGLRVLDVQLDLVSADSTALLALLGEIGVAVLLFRVGLESDLGKLVAELPRATLVWVSNVALSAGLGFVVAWGLGLGLVPSLFVAVALSATSIGLSVMIWRDAGRLDTPLGALLVDVAELDDLSAIVMTSLLVIAAPMLAGGELLPGQLGAAFGWMAVKIVGFGVACVLFSRYLEEPLTRAFVHDEGDRSATAVLFLVGTCLAIAGIAGGLGFSVAVGALFAGLMFSRDPEAVRAEHSFEPIHALFAPFFFVDIGFGVDVALLGASMWIGMVLLVPAVLGKLLGVAIVLAPREGWRLGVMMGVSMIPRAEIALVVARLGHGLGEWAVSRELYGGLVLVSVVTATAAPLWLQRMFGRDADSRPMPT